MSDSYIPQDYDARQRALEASHSFIVQAPAGAGKTGLLTQRFLKLLTVVEYPESIVAITFTRKAAGEMRERIIIALKEALSSPLPEAPHAAQTWKLAQQVIARDTKKQWGLMENPGRLRVQTFDSLSAWLAAQMPLLSEFGSRPNTLEDASAIYNEAALNTIKQLKDDSIVADAVAVLLSHLDNKVAHVVELIASMLARRDQWLRHVADKDNPQLTRGPIELALKKIVIEELDKLIEAFPKTLESELLELIAFAADNLEQNSAFYCCRDLPNLPEPSELGLVQWQAIANFLLTQKGGWRSDKGITKKIGFPAQEKLHKQRMMALLGELREMPDLQKHFTGLDKLPAFCFEDSEWEVLNALFVLLRYAVLELKLAFQSHGQVDFAEISLKSLYALGQIDEPSELLLKLDYQIQHLLVDEFQDTSINQFQLLEKLTSGWENGDSRSLFLVGDPMQSIYRFREAEVGLFIQAKNYGIGSVQPQFLQLSVNFRSQGGVIDWVNQAFPQVFPSQEDMYLGAVSYAPSVAAKERLPGTAVCLYPQVQRDDQEEARQVLEIIHQAQQDKSDDSIAILVSGRGHLKEIVHLLGREKITFNAVKIDLLANKPVVKDLMALTLALLHLEARIHWLAILRAPWCGLTLADLLIVSDNSRETIFQRLHNSDCLKQLSPGGEAKVNRLRKVIQHVIQQRNRKSLRDWIEGCWIAIGGPAVFYSEDEKRMALIDAEEYFQLLEKLDQGGDLANYFDLEKQVERLYAQSDPEVGKSLQIMTIHAAKGLEFDTVIIPGMGRSPGWEQSQLLYWLETSQDAKTQLLFAPITATEDRNNKAKVNKTAAYIKKLESEKRLLESARLLYVALTRAKKHLHLLGHVAINSKDEITPPPASSLLNSLWPVVGQNYEEHRNTHPIAEQLDDIEQQNNEPKRYCLTNNWQCPEPSVLNFSNELNEEIINPEDVIEFNWAGDVSRHVGTVVHRILEYLALLDDNLLDSQYPYKAVSRQLLASQGLSGDDLELASKRVIEALENTLNDNTGRWIISSQHQLSACELPLSIVDDGEIHHMIIDRTFVDKDDVRWIIDYKTGSHSGGNLDEFLEHEQERYRSQLQGYAKAMSKIENRTIKTALYFPLLKEFMIISEG